MDCALSPLGNGTSQPATEALVATLQGTPYDTGIDIHLLADIAKHFRQVADKLTAQGVRDPKILQVDVNTLLYQVPGGMLSNLINQLKQAGKSDQLYKVLEEVPGYGKTSASRPWLRPPARSWAPRP